VVWVKLIGLALQLTLWLLSWAERQQAIKEGEANVLRDLLEKSNELIDSSQRARDSITADHAGNVLDEFNRDVEEGGGGSTGPKDPL
jgi:hypothetical protein